MANKLEPTVSRGKVSYNESIVKGIVALAVQSVDGVVIKKNKRKERSIEDSIKILKDKNGIYVSVSVCVSYSHSISDVAFNIQNSIRQNVETMSTYKISKVDVFVSDVLFEDKSITD